MIRLTFLLALAACGLLFATVSRPVAATSHWTPLLSCPDVDGDGRVLIGDVARVLGS